MHAFSTFGLWWMLIMILTMMLTMTIQPKLISNRLYDYVTDEPIEANQCKKPNVIEAKNIISSFSYGTNQTYSNAWCTVTSRNRFANTQLWCKATVDDDKFHSIYIYFVSRSVVVGLSVVVVFLFYFSFFFCLILLQMVCVVSFKNAIIHGELCWKDK